MCPKGINICTCIYFFFQRYELVIWNQNQVNMGIGKFEMVDMLVGFQPISPLLLFAGKQMVANGFNTLFRERENILHNFLKTYNEMRYNSEEPSNDFLSFFFNIEYLSLGNACRVQPLWQRGLNSDSTDFNGKLFGSPPNLRPSTTTTNKEEDLATFLPMLQISVILQQI